jgi:hypothetical protein
MANRICDTYSVSFRGIFGRNRSHKHTSSSPAEVKATVPTTFPEGDAVDVKALADAFVIMIGAKVGNIRVTRYENTEVISESSVDGPVNKGPLYSVPITQGVVVYAESIGGGL